MPAAAVVLASAFVASCGSSGSSGTQDSGSSPASLAPGGLRTQVLSSPNGERFRISAKKEQITVTAPASNTKIVQPREKSVTGDDWSKLVSEVFWEQGQPKRTDERVCVTAASILDASDKEQVSAYLMNPESASQPGLALRIAPRPFESGTRAIVIRQTLSYGAIWKFDVVGIRTSTDGDKVEQSTHSIDQIDAGDSVGRWSADAVENGLPGFTTTMKPPPWRLCAQVVGTELSFKVWPEGADEPSWEDDELVYRVEVPENWVYQGNAGGYQVRLNPGNTSKFSDLEATSPY